MNILLIQSAGQHQEIVPCQDVQLQNNFLRLAPQCFEHLSSNRCSCIVKIHTDIVWLLHLYIPRYIISDRFRLGGLWGYIAPSLKLQGIQRLHVLKYTDYCIFKQNAIPSEGLPSTTPLTSIIHAFISPILLIHHNVYSYSIS